MVDPLNTSGRKFVDATGGFANSGHPLTVTIGYMAQKTQVSGIHCGFTGGPVSPPANKIMAALFALNPITRTPAAYIAGSETTPITFAQAASNYTTVYGAGTTANGLLIPMSPTILGVGPVGLAILLSSPVSPSIRD